MALTPRNEDENTKTIKRNSADRNATQSDWRRFETRTQQLEQQQRARERAEAQDLLMRNLEKLENNESERNNRNEKLKNELKDSISTFNQATEDTRVKYISVANSYLKKLNTDNQQQDFKQALDAKFKAIDKQTDQLIHELKTQ